jgi:hypothetical protein
MGESIKDFTKSVILQDAIVNIFMMYLKLFSLEDIIEPDRLDVLIDRFEKTYHSYIITSFEQLDVQIIKMNQTEYILVGELMAKVTNLMASKLAAELLLLEVAGKLEH